jgi:methyl-accepting chemotaxis protein
MLLKLLPRSLWMQTLLLLALSVAVTFAISGPIFSSKFEEQQNDELQRRGTTTVQTLEKHSDLRLAATLSDAAQAAPVLKAVADGEEDLRYLALLGPGHAPIASAPATLASGEIDRIVHDHFAPPTDEVKRFTQAIVRSKEAGAGTLDFGAEPAKAEKGKDADVLGYVVLGLSTQRLKSKIRLQTLAAVGTTSLIVFTLITLFYFRWVARRLHRMVNFAQKVAEGDLTGKLADPVADDLGQLATALGSMSTRTGGVVKELVTASTSLSAASSDVFDSSTRQGSNTAKQAASVSEMGATVAELRETFGHATTKAESVIDLARRSEESSTGGAKAVREAIDGMEQLREQVVAIAETIRGLVQRTDQIDAILEVVNGLTEQSNVLALNAGIEAARAGEHGRGFAVVAREVRSLAERSKESTSQVRSILQDIKLAGRDAVRVIEEGSRRADGGVAVAAAAGDAIKLLGEAIAASSTAAMQIASSTRQQSVGIEQLWQATKEIDRIARETADGIQQLEGAAGNMKSLSKSMEALVGRYKIA